jgi:hypothetical protein
METPQKDQLMAALVLVALLEARELSVRVAEIIAHLQHKEHLAALGALHTVESHYKLLDAVLSAAARLER